VRLKQLIRMERSIIIDYGVACIIPEKAILINEIYGRLFARIMITNEVLSRIERRDA